VTSFQCETRSFYTHTCILNNLLFTCKSITILLHSPSNRSFFLKKKIKNLSILCTISRIACGLCGFARVMHLCPYSRDSFLPVPWIFAPYSRDPRPYSHLALLSLLQRSFICACTTPPCYTSPSQLWYHLLRKIDTLGSLFQWDHNIAYWNTTQSKSLSLRIRS
jgi:hypothetical protein